jgi:hypothetical protein
MIVSPKVFLFTTVAALVGGASKYAAADIVDDWSTLPWDDLEGTLSEHATLFKSDNPVATYKAECMPEFTKKYSDRTNHNLINQRSGLCTDQLFCSFRSCNPYQDFKTPNVIEESVDAPGAYVTLGYKEGDNLPVNQNQMDRMLSDDNPSWNIPNYVLHPATASDVVSAVNFAKEHGLEVSVKNSGHVSTSLPAINILVLIICIYLTELFSIPFHIHRITPIVLSRCIHQERYFASKYEQVQVVFEFYFWN